MSDFRDNRDPELMGEAVARLTRRPGQRLSEALDAAGELSVPDFGSAAAVEARARLNGHLARASERFGGGRG